MVRRKEAPCCSHWSAHSGGSGSIFVNASTWALMLTGKVLEDENEGGIEGTLQYQAASGEGECQLHPRGSAYSAGRRRLQLSPESCTPHYPRELGVPLDFDRVNPEASTLKNGRIEAPTGEVITVRLERGT